MDVDRIEPDKGLPLLVSIDPGSQHPAVIVSQMKRCMFEQEHYVRLSEISDIRNRTTNELVELNSPPTLGILEHLGLYYPYHFDLEFYKQMRRKLVYEGRGKPDYNQLSEFFLNIRFCIDGRGGKRVYSTSKEKETDRLILLWYYGIKCTFRTNISLEASLRRVNEGFGAICMCGKPTYLIDTDHCSLLISAYKGGYRYEKRRNGTRSDEPIRDAKYEDVADADRYGLENFFFSTGLVIEESEPHQAEWSPYDWSGELIR